MPPKTIEKERQKKQNINAGNLQANKEVTSNVVFNGQVVFDAEKMSRYAAANRKLLENDGLSEYDRIIINSKKDKKLSYDDLNFQDDQLEGEEAHKYSDYYTAPGYFEKKSRRSAAKDSQADHKKAVNRINAGKTKTLDDALELIRLSGHAECNAVLSLGLGDDSTDYLEARNRLLSKRIRAIRNAGRENSRKYKKLFVNAVKELRKNKDKINRLNKPEEIDKQICQHQAQEQFRMLSKANGCKDEDIEKYSNRVDYKSARVIGIYQHIFARNRVDQVAFNSRLDAYEKQINFQDQSVEVREHIFNKKFELVSPFLNIVNYSDIEGYNAKDNKKIGENEKLIRAYIGDDQEAYNSVMEDRLNDIMKFRFPFDPLNAKDEDYIEFIPQIEKIQHLSAALYLDDLKADPMFKGFLGSLGLTEDKEKKGFVDFLRAYFQSVYTFAARLYDYVENKLHVTCGEMSNDTSIGAALGSINLDNAQTIKEHELGAQKALEKGKNYLYAYEEGSIEEHMKNCKERKFVDEKACKHGADDEDERRVITAGGLGAGVLFEGKTCTLRGLVAEFKKFEGVQI